MRRHFNAPAVRLPCAFESLETRRLWSAGPEAIDAAVDNSPPRVEAVYVDSTAWTPTFRAALDENKVGDSRFGVEAPEGNVADSPRKKTLSWINLNQITIQFSEDVSVQQNDLTLESASGATYNVVGFEYDPQTFTATWTLDQPIRADLLTLRLDGTSATGVTDLAGNPLKGNAKEGGGGESGRDFTQTLAVLPGDVNRDGRVNALDLGAVKARANTTPAAPGRGARYGVFYDVNGDGRINALDLGAVKARANSVLPESGDGAVLA